MIEIKHNPTRKDLFWFGVLLPIFFGVFGGMIWWRYQAPTVAYCLWTFGALLGGIYAVAPPSRLWIYLGWNYAVFPIGWTVTHVIMALVYYIVFTPIGLIMRLVGYDPMQRKIDRQASSYWIEHRTGETAKSRYFRQF